MGRACPTHGQCFYYAARRRMAHAQVLVVNHAVFFADLALRRGGASLLPQHDIVIFDEAHMAEAVASEHLGIGVSSAGIERVLSKLHNDRTHRGLLLHYKLHDLEADVRRCRRAAEAFFASVKDAHGVIRRGGCRRRDSSPTSSASRSPASPGGCEPRPTASRPTPSGTTWARWRSD
jgi:ATP-dependent DNA helicase DinG